MRNVHRLPVAVLQALARQRLRPAAEEEPASALVAERPDQVADTLEAEHRIEDEERDRRLAHVAYDVAAGERRHRPAC
jgi:hypothetical protein